MIPLFFVRLLTDFGILWLISMGFLLADKKIISNYSKNNFGLEGFSDLRGFGFEGFDCIYIYIFIYIYIYSQTPQIRNASNPKNPLIRNYFQATEKCLK